MKSRYIGILLLGLMLVGSAVADGPRPFWQSLWNRGSVCPPTGCCPNDYVHKPIPSICPLPRCGGPDDYCRKPMPCVPNLPRCGGPDDYCRKAMPCLLCPPISPYLQCGSPEDQCPVCGKRRVHFTR